MNEATQQRLLERMQQEGYKEPEEEAMNDNPAEDSNPQQTQTIYTSPTHPSTDVESEQYAQHLREQEIALQQYGNRSVNQVTEQLAQTNISPEESPCGSVGEDLWKCDRCGYDSPLMHRFCGVCGGEKPEDWWCSSCQYSNSAYHRFCGLCGTSKPANNLNVLGYEDVAGLDPEDEAAINDTVARMSHHQDGQPSQQQWDEDDAYSFAEETCCNTAQPPPQQPQEQEEESTAWSCQICTFVNENPIFMCCEMCGSARPEESAPSETPPGKQQPEGRNKQRRNSNVSESSSKKKEKTNTQRIREQQMEQFKQQGGGADQQQLPEPETDHELALIYAQQERILAQYQQQQMQQR